MTARKEDLATIVGTGYVNDNPEALKAWARDQSLTPERKPVMIVEPGTADEVQGIVRWANKTKTPLVPVSSGEPHFRGDTVPGSDGAVIVDLRRMNRIIMTDRRNRVAVVEPGVTYGRLQQALNAEGMRLSMPLMPRATKSVLGAILEREPITNPRYAWSLTEPLRCVEVVMGNGALHRTGELAGANVSTSTRQEAKFMPIEELLERRRKTQDTALYQYGPGQFNYHKLLSAAQGTMGIVTWASLRCEVLPEVQKFHLIPSKDFAPLVNLAYKLLRFRFHDELFLCNRHCLSSLLGNPRDTGATAADGSPWVMVLGIAGRGVLPHDRVEFLEKDIAAIAGQFNLRLESTACGAAAESVGSAILKPSPEPYWKLRDKGGCHEIFFLTTLNRSQEFIGAMHEAAADARYPLNDIGVYIQPTHMGTSCHVEFHLPYDPGNRKETEDVHNLFVTASKQLSDKGAFFSRPYGIWADLAFTRDPGQASLLRKVKHLFDPRNVLNPGRLCFAGHNHTTEDA